MDLQRLLDPWIEWARKSIPDASDLPLLDVVGLVMHCSIRVPEKLAKLGALLPNPSDLPHPPVFEAEDSETEDWPWDDPFSPSGLRDHDLEFLRVYLKDAPNDLAIRFVVLSYLYYVAHSVDVFSEDDMELHGVDEDDVDKLLESLRELVRLQDPDRLMEPRVVKWEVVNACAVREWGRAIELYDRLFDLESPNEATRRALLGHFRFLRVLAERSEDVARFGLWWWTPELCPSLVLARKRSSLLVTWALAPQEAEVYSQEHIRHLSDAVNDLSLAFREGTAPPTELRFLMAKGYSILGDHLKAAREYETLLRSVLAFSDEWWSPGNTEKLYSRTGESYVLAGDRPRAIQLLEACVNEFPMSRGYWRRIAELQAKNADYEAAYESLCKEVDVDPGLEERDVGVAVALALGGVRAVRSYEAKLQEHPEYARQIEAIVGAHWPGLSMLSERSRREWIAGAWFLWGPQIRDEDRPSLYEAAANKFGLAMEGELKARVFEPFRQHVQAEQELARVAEQGLQSRRAGSLCRFLLREGFVTLGQMLSSIFAAKPVPAEKELQDWVRQGHARLADEFGYWSREWQEINRFRQRGAHPMGPVSEKDAREMYRLCLRFLDELLAEGGQGT